MRKIIIGVMGPGKGATEKDKKRAFEIGKLIAQNGWVLLSGGRNEGVMDAVNKGAKTAGGLTLGILPSKDGSDASDAVDIAIITGMGSARNVINVLSSNVIIACGMGAGTASEIAHVLKIKKNVVLLTDNKESKAFFSKLAKAYITIAADPVDAIKTVRRLLLQKKL